MKKLLLAATCLMTLSGCASAIGSQMQEVTMRTPGATNARCMVENPDHRYIFFTDETIEIMKSKHDLLVHCRAPGNREQTIHVKRGIDDWVFVNVSNGFVPGATLDVLSRAAFDYPNEIVVSFVGVPIKPYPLPEYHNSDLRYNNEYNNTEYMGPGVLVTEETRNYVPSILGKKEDQYSGTSDFDDSTPRAGKMSGSDLDAIHRQYNSVDSYNSSEEDK